MFVQHGVKTIVIERVEYAWLDTFADEGDAGLNISWEAEQAEPVGLHLIERIADLLDAAVGVG